MKNNYITHKKEWQTLKSLIDDVINRLHNLFLGMNILVSACLLGFDVKYDGTNNAHVLDSQKFERLKKMVNIIPFCPEIFGGLSTPRTPCEIKNDKVINRDGQDKTQEFKAGSNQALKAAQLFNCSYALLKENSPSCGSNTIYDGTFSHTKKTGSGITARLFLENNIKVFNENQLDELIEAVRLAKAPMQLSFNF